MRDDPTAGFIHFGDGPLRASLIDKVASLGLARRFIFAGFRDDLPRVLPLFDLFVQPSFTEGLPCVVLEAFASGVPVVATAVGGTPEVVSDPENGRLVPPGDPLALAAQIVECLRDPQKRQTMGENGRRLVLDRFSFIGQVRLYQELFDSLPSRCLQTPERTCARRLHRPKMTDKSHIVSDFEIFVRGASFPLKALSRIELCLIKLNYRSPQSAVKLKYLENILANGSQIGHRSNNPDWCSKTSTSNLAER